MKYLIMSCFLWLCVIQGQGQENQNAFIKGYDSYYRSEHEYFDSVNALLKKDIECFNIVHQVYASFKVDTNGNVTDLQITEMPVYKLPNEMKVYIEKLITSTNGKWLPQVRNGQRIISDEIIYRFDFLKANQKMKERIDATSKLVEYYLDHGYKVDIIKRFDDMRKFNIFTILY